MFSIFGHLILHFALPPRIYSFGQNPKYWCSLRVFWFLILVFLFVCLFGVFLVCVCVFFWMRVGMCVHNGEQIGKQFYLSSSFPSRNKTNLYICYFLFFLIMHRIKEKWVSWISNLRFSSLEVWFSFARLTYFSCISLGLKCLEMFLPAFAGVMVACLLFSCLRFTYLVRPRRSCFLNAFFSSPFGLQMALSPLAMLFLIPLLASEGWSPYRVKWVPNPSF